MKIDEGWEWGTLCLLQMMVVTRGEKRSHLLRRVVQRAGRLKWRQKQRDRVLDKLCSRWHSPTWISVFPACTECWIYCIITPHISQNRHAILISRRDVSSAAHVLCVYECQARLAGDTYNGFVHRSHLIKTVNYCNKAAISSLFHFSPIPYAE